MVNLLRLHLVSALVVWCTVLISIRPSHGGDAHYEPRPKSDSSQISDEDRAIIGRSTHSVWFDTNDGSIRPIRAVSSVNVDDRHDSISANVSSAPPAWWVSLKNILADFFGFLFESWQILMLVALVIVLVIAGFVVLRYGLNLQSYTGKTTDVSILEREKAKLLELPFEVEQTMFGLLAQAEKYRAAGDYSKAIIYLFSHALVEMDGARCIRLARGKTNRAYLRELRDQESLRFFTNQLVQAFEYAFFGKHVLSQEAFERIWEQVPTFDANIKKISPQPNKSNRFVPIGNA